MLGRRSGHGASCSLGSTDIFCQTEGKQQPRLGEISSPRARQGTLLPGLARAAANWKIIQKISTPTLGFDFSMHDVPSKKSGEGWKVFPITFPQNTCRTIYGKAPGEHGRTPRTRPSQAPRRCHSLLPTTTSLHPCSAAQPGLLCLEKIHPKQKKNIEVFKRHQQSSPRSNTGGTRRSQQVPRLLTLFFFLPQLPVRSIS